MTWLIVPAAGISSRFGSELPKQYHLLGSKSVLELNLRGLCKHPAVSGVMLALAADDPHWPAVAAAFGWLHPHSGHLQQKPVLTCEGGATRADSVLAALRALPDSVASESLVAVHDAARPGLSPSTLSAVLAAAAGHPVGAIVALPVFDTIKQLAADRSIARTVDRASLVRAQTPQVFRRGQLMRALDQARAQGITVSDEAQAMELVGAFGRVVEGSEVNLKITSQTDLKLLQLYLQMNDG